MIKKPVEDCGGEDFVIKRSGPFSRGFVGGDYQKRFLVQGVYQVEEACGVLFLDRDSIMSSIATRSVQMSSVFSAHIPTLVKADTRCGSYRTVRHVSLSVPSAIRRRHDRIAFPNISPPP